jgi:hypothetical protein
LDRPLKEVPAAHFEALSQNFARGAEIKNNNLTIAGVQDSVRFGPDFVPNV